MLAREPIGKGGRSYTYTNCFGDSRAAVEHYALINGGPGGTRTPVDRTVTWCTAKRYCHSATDPFDMEGGFTPPLLALMPALFRQASYRSICALLPDRREWVIFKLHHTGIRTGT